MPPTVPVLPPAPLPPDLTGWAFLLGRRTRVDLRLAIVAPDGKITFAMCAP